MRLRLLFTFFVVSFVFANSQIVNIPDAILKDALLNHSPNIDTNNDDEIQVSEALLFTDLVIVPSFGVINSIEGLDGFSNLENLFLSNAVFSNTLEFQNYLNLQTLDLEEVSFQNLNLDNLISLEELRIRENDNENFTSIDFPNCNCTNLERLILVLNFSLTNIDISDRINLKTFDIIASPISGIDISNNINLEIFRVYGTGITELDFSVHPNLLDLRINEQTILELNVTNSRNLNYLDIDDPELDILDLGNNGNLNHFILRGGEVGFLNLKNGNTPNTIAFFNTSVGYLCVDSDEEIFYENTTFTDGSPLINDYCSFTPGGDYHTIQGRVALDNEFDGCDSDDLTYSNVKFIIDDGISTGTYFGDSTGNYSLALPDGSYNITPILVNPDYFEIDPTTVSYDFTSGTTFNSQDFCMLPEGMHRDLEISIVPIGQAVPGFNARYRLLYKNVGDTVMAGTIDFNYGFDSDYMEYEFSNPAEISNLNNVLSWDYENLNPLETRQIVVTFNLNTPTDPNFPLNSGDELNFDVTIYPTTVDETPNNNDNGLKQIVVNSFDPNDISCLQGNRITPDRVGEYLNYLIRFENLGTANATNIVVKNSIDVSKFDITTLVPLNGSHNFYTRINEQNEVEFIFENIDLPFDDATNDGYVLYKIKTLESLVLGDTFSNQAEIYFDFNAPIITNTYVTEIAEDNLSILDTNLIETRAYPNPVNDILTIESDAVISSAIIYDINGREILSSEFEDSYYQMNLSAFQAGIYFLKVLSNLENQTLKVIKK